MIIDVDPSWRQWLEEPIPDARCYEGWQSLIVETLAAFDAVMRRGGRLRIVEIKEIGGLRIYIAAVGTNEDQNDRLFRIRREAERRSFGVCEICGDPGVLAKVRGLYATRCDAHPLGTGRPRIGR